MTAPPLTGEPGAAVPKDSPPPPGPAPAPAAQEEAQEETQAQAQVQQHVEMGAPGHAGAVGPAAGPHGEEEEYEELPLLGPPVHFRGEEEIQDKLLKRLLSATHHNHYPAMRCIVRDKNFDIDCFFQGETLLHYSVTNNYLVLARLLLEFKIDTRLKDYSNATALHLACEVPNFDMARLLIKHGASVHARNAVRATPLHIVAENNAVDIAAELIKAGASVDDDEVGATPLQNASYKDCPEMVKILLDSGAKIDAQNDVGASALLLAVDAGCLKIVRLLLSRGAAVQSQNKSLATPLHFATLDTRIDMARALLQYGASLTVQNCNGATPVDVCHGAKIQAFFREAARQRWSDRRHRTFGKGARDAVKALFLSVHRQSGRSVRGAAEANASPETVAAVLPPVPVEIQLLICSFLTRSDF